MAGTQTAPGKADLLIQSVTDYAIYMLDADGVVRTWNAGAARLKGYAPDEIIGRHFSTFYPESDRQNDVPARALAIASAEGRLETGGWRIRKDGTTFWADVVIDAIRDDAGKLVGFAKITRDRTARRSAEEALRRSEERFRLLVQCVTDYAIYMLDLDGRITSWNAGAERFKGYVADEIIGEHFSRFYLPEDRAAGVPQRALETARTVGRFEAEGWRVRKDGTRFWANAVIDPIRNPEGELIGFAKITRDLTERRNTQLALEEAQQQVFQSQKLEAIGKLTGGVAHDFNNILAAIMGSLNLARRRMERGEDVTRFIDNALQAVERGATLTQRMLAFARKQELKLEPVDLATCIAGMAELLQRTIGPGVAIETRFPLTLAPVLADRAQLELALINLAVNARDAMAHEGRIVLSAAQLRAEDSGREFICLSVADDGEGMDEVTLEKAAEPFFTTKGVGRGTGLGLSMVKGMVEQCGGRLMLHSRPGEGTRVELLLPACEASPESAAPPPAPVPDCRCLNILAVDDDPIVLLNTATMLADRGHHVEQAHSAAAALDLLERRNYDLLVTDYAMPGMTGGDLIARVRERHPAVRLLVVTGYADLPDGVLLPAPRLAKPFQEADLAAKIAEVFGPPGVRAA